MATPAGVTAELLKSEDKQLSEALLDIRYVPLISSTVFVRKSQLKKVPQGVGVLNTEPNPCLGILFNSSSWINRVEDSENVVSLTVMLGGSHFPEVLEWSDEQIQSYIEKELGGLFGLSGQLQGIKIFRWERAIPQYGQALKMCWETALQGWCRTPGRVLFGNYTGTVSLRGMIEKVTSYANEITAPHQLS